MKRLTPKAAFRKLAALYDRMVADYTGTASAIGLTCDGCTDNCCRSFFQHHTYVEWAYLWEGLSALPADRLAVIREKAEAYVNDVLAAQARGERPTPMCPLNIDERQGVCGLYGHRLMICRLHGVPNVMARPGGGMVRFPGCYRCQELTAGAKAEGRDIPAVDRTPLYRDLATLEMQFVGADLRRLPKVDHTIAEMIVLGPPRLR